jgi:Nuclear pore complex assembly
VAKAGLFYYYLLDAGAPGSTDAASYAASCGQLTGQAPPLSHNFASQVRAGYLLDESCERPVALDRAGALLACGACGGSSTPLQFVSELLHRGAYGWALDVMHARRGGRVADDLDEAVAWVTTCLHGGHLHHAFAHAQLLCESIADPKERMHAATQVVQLTGAHCKARGALGQLIALPWSCPEEEVLAQWLLSEAADGSLTGEAFPALYACRRRWSEAAHAHATLQKVDASLGGPGATLPVELRSIKQRLAEARSAMMAQHVPHALAAAAAHTLVTQPVAADGLPPSLDEVAPPPPVHVLLGSDAQAAETLASAVGGAPPASWALRSVGVGATGMPVLVGPPPATWAAMRAASARHALFAAAASPEQQQQQQQQQRPADAEMAGPDMQLFDNALPVMRLNFDAMRAPGPAPGGEQRGRVDSPTGTPSLAPRGAQSLLFGRTATAAGQDTQTAHGGGDSTAAFSTRRASRAAAAFDVAAAGASEQSLLRALAAGATPRREVGGTPKRPRRSTASYARAE